MKKCSKCKNILENNQFSNCQLKKSGGVCRQCNSIIIKQYNIKNFDKIKKYHKEYDKNYYLTNKKSILQYKKSYYKANYQIIIQNRKIYYKNNLNKIKLYNQIYLNKNKQHILNKSKQYFIKNSDKIKKYQKEYIKNRKKYDLKLRLKCSISANISFYLRSHCFNKNKQSTLKYLPYSINELKEHLENRFESWMNWNNYGRYDAKLWNDNDVSTWTWQIDHIIPHSTFNYSSMNDEDFKKCWSLNNLRPLSSKQNFIDGINRTRHGQ